ncbi:DUF4367 domain-containing protein [Ectobacillus ponti]|uniref:DUF4367 domain-containing protein n=1 Tax=Ectobacillus ponti TaxID=2961894 RepID=A0AA42BNJ8_9BACI|nr:DUF4367 domain-containing protein [Ectobacillus ponti]MCP8968065.1 DUF4367 domain-containing protein [Ectobacillus ponti]
MFRILCILLLVSTLSSPASAYPSVDPVQGLIYSLFHHRDEKMARKYIAPGVHIPEIREETPISGAATLSSPRKNMRVVVARYRDSKQLERTAFIWELAVKDDKITKIRVVHDGAVPLMNEGYAVQKFEKAYPQYKDKVLVPADFPFSVTHVQGKASNHLVLQYSNRKNKLRLTIVPQASLSKGDILLQQGVTASYHTRCLTFHKDGLQYTLSGLPKEELIMIAKSMLPKP